jgi:hypothetical protein
MAFKHQENSIRHLPIAQIFGVCEIRQEVIDSRNSCVFWVGFCA